MSCRTRTPEERAAERQAGHADPAGAPEREDVAAAVGHAAWRDDADPARCEAAEATREARRAGEAQREDAAKSSAGSKSSSSRSGSSKSGATKRNTSKRSK
jgi:hypothetical protein